MDTTDFIVSWVAGVLLVYLLIALFFPERFQ
jgi:K+-transporting ATPase KdpF subunit